MIPITVSYDLESVATPKPLPESPYVHLKHADFLLLIQQVLVC